MAYELQSVVNAQKLAAYETDAYKTAPCIINFGFKHEDVEPRKV